MKELLDTGTTGLGGARPKASVRLDDGSLAIAKFPHGSDQWDVMAWEATALNLAEAAGIRVPLHTLTRVGNRSVIVLRRFDRTTAGHRVGYISAMTVLSASDGEQRDYADLAEVTRDLSFSPRRDLHELFDRVVASVALGNTDDHLRNHGFLLGRGSWALSPVFDVNPNPDPWHRRATSILGADTLPEEAEALLPFAEECDLPVAQARARIERIAGAIAGWRGMARRNGIPERELTLMAEGIGPRLAAVMAVTRSVAP